MEEMDYKKLQNTSTVDILSHLYKDYRPKKRKDVYEVERLISKREGIEVSKQINIKFQLFARHFAACFRRLAAQDRFRLRKDKTSKSNFRIPGRLFTSF